MLIAPAILLLLALQPQINSHSHDKEELKKWKPGPMVAQELARLEKEGRTMFRAFREGKLAQLTLIRELARVKTTMEELREWSFANHSDEVPNLVVLIDSAGYYEIFPHGMKHLSGGLAPGGIYPATPGSSRRWQFLGERRVTGMRLAVFKSSD